MHAFPVQHQNDPLSAETARTTPKHHKPETTAARCAPARLLLPRAGAERRAWLWGRPQARRRKAPSTCELGQRSNGSEGIWAKAGKRRSRLEDAVNSARETSMALRLAAACGYLPMDEAETGRANAGGHAARHPAGSRRPAT